MDPNESPATEPTAAEKARNLNSLADLFGEGGPPDLDDLDGPVFWPSIPASEIADEWHSLRIWVERYVKRFRVPERHIPFCWYRHNELVEALAALRDYERASYSSTAPATAAVDFHRAARDIEARIVTWSSNIGCVGGAHEDRGGRRALVEADAARFADFVTDDEVHRQSAAVSAALADGD